MNCRETFTRLAANTPLSPEEFQNEADSPYTTKRYHYNYRHPEEQEEDCLRRTFINMAVSEFYSRSEKTVRAENLNFDAMTSREREDMVYKLNTELESISQTPDANESFFSSLSDSTTQKQFKLWKQHLQMPMTDTIRERAMKKVKKQEDDRVIEENKD